MQIDNKTITGNVNQSQPQAPAGRPASASMNQLFMAMVESMKRAKDMRQLKEEDETLRILYETLDRQMGKDNGKSTAQQLQEILDKLAPKTAG
ncbi:hypothetical protein D7X94_10070 [Acutalibacter sp. 1XD8-33]|uniref:hypothetical protein n=1 Tax=Acutalibacter sp. 1XD8-33 TaxID=2320081 RepID=UPI000EA324CF|nr:hypothetical protein [Acutalibacter sp. 1XD8-33]RKJ39964.1 hypothetical protein D7X94_10070 [Acutalibacter sp. 1XD8-33]